MNGNTSAAGIPKTSEYAFFKKVMEGAIQRNPHSLNKESERKLKDAGHCYPNILHKEKEKLKKSKTNDYTSSMFSFLFVTNSVCFSLHPQCINNKCNIYPKK